MSKCKISDISVGDLVRFNRDGSFEFSPDDVILVTDILQRADHTQLANLRVLICNNGNLYEDVLMQRWVHKI